MGCGASSVQEPRGAAPAPTPAAGPSLPQALTALQPEEAKVRAPSSPSSTLQAVDSSGLDDSSDDVVWGSEEGGPKDPGGMMRMCVSMQWLQQEFEEGSRRGKMTPAEFARDVVGPATAGRKCRYIDIMGPAARPAHAPVYWVVLEPGCRHSLGSLLGLIIQHIQMLEPGRRDVSGVGVWVDLLCCNHHKDMAQQAGAYRAWLDGTPACRATLACLQRVRRRTPNRGNSSSIRRAPPGDGRLAMQQSQRSLQPSNVAPSLPSTVDASMLCLADDIARQPSYEPAMTLWRTRKGLHGYQRAMLDSPHTVYLD